MPGVVIVQSRDRTLPNAGYGYADCATAVGTANDPSAITGGAAYYIATTGSDSTGDGSSGNPWKTYNKFISLPPDPGDTLYCRGGTYTSVGSCTIANLAGTAAAPITIRNYPGETPIFQGTDTIYNYGLLIQQATEYLILDGLQFTNFQPTQAGVIEIYDAGTGVAPHHITIRNCKITQLAGLTVAEHCIDIGRYSHDVTVEDCILIGNYATGTEGCGINNDHAPASYNMLIQRNVFDDCAKGIYIWGSTATGSFLHNSFVNCYSNIRLNTSHGAILIRDNAGTDAAAGTAWNIYDPVPAGTTADHNYWGQTFDSDYYLLDGNTGIDGASDGTDAGAYDRVMTVGRGVGTATAYGVTALADSSYESTILTDSPSFVLPMDEASGTLTDIVAALSATASGSPTYGVTGPVTGHTAIDFASSSDYFTVGDNAALDLGDGAFSIEWWMARDTDAGTWQFALSKGTNAYGVGVNYDDDPSFVKTDVVELATQVGTTVPTDGSWHHYVLTRSATRGSGSTKLYVDGSAVTTTEYSTSTTLADNSSSLYIGRESGGNPILGKLAYIALYKSVLSSTRIADHYAARTLG